MRDGKTFSGQFDGRLEESGPWQLPITVVGLFITSNFPWDSNPLAPWMDVNMGKLKMVNGLLVLNCSFFFPFYNLIHIAYVYVYTNWILCEMHISYVVCLYL